MPTVVAKLKRESDGSVKDYVDEWKREPLNGTYSILAAWTEGNYSCDCNRAIFFGDANPGDDDNKCGEERYTLLALTCDGEPIDLDD